MTLGGPAVVNLQPPPIYRYPSFSSSFGQRIVDVVGRSRKSEALKILNAFDDSTKQAQLFMEKAIEYTSRANELMAKVHECFSSMQKLVVDVRDDKIAANEARRRARSRNEQPSASAIEEDGDDECAAAGDDSAAGSEGEIPEGEMSANHSSPEDGNQYDVNSRDREDPSDENTSPLSSHGNVDAQETSISSNSLIFLTFII